MSGKPEIEKSASTEEQIKDAARRVFMRKGYAATRTRDIAEESGFNLSLINYYFRSKEKLFDMIMVEHLQLFLHSVMGLLNDPETSLHQKMEQLISHYIDMLLQNPNLPLFVLNQVNVDPSVLISKIIGENQAQHNNLFIVKQWNEVIARNGNPRINPIHMLMNVLSLTIFPFIGSPIIRNRTGISVEEFNKLMEERKKLIPMWINGMILAWK